MLFVVVGERRSYWNAPVAEAVAVAVVDDDESTGSEEVCREFALLFSSLAEPSARGSPSAWALVFATLTGRWFPPINSLSELD